MNSPVQIASKRTVTAVGSGLAAAALVLTLSACGSDKPAAQSTVTQTNTTTQTTTQAPVNDADKQFAQHMLAHHEQAVLISDWALQKANNAKVKELASTIKQSQGTEIETMKQWLKAWGVPVPNATDPHAGMDHSTMGDGSSQEGENPEGNAASTPPTKTAKTATTMAGMLSDQELKTLQGASGATFDRLWLTGMIKHHEGAVVMANEEKAKGANPDALALADTIITTQKSEIDQMKQLLATIK